MIEFSFIHQCSFQVMNASDNKEMEQLNILLSSTFLQKIFHFQVRLSFFYSYEQYLFNKHSINPMQMVGFEGIFGIIIISIVVVGLSFVPCNFSEQICAFNSQNQSYIQLPEVFSQEVFSSPLLIILVVFAILSVLVLNLSGVKITQIFDGLTRSLLNVSTTALIWIIGLIVTFSGSSDSDSQANDDYYKLESKDIWVNLVKLMGFLFIVTGNLIFNRILLKNNFQNQNQKFQQEDHKNQFKKNYAKLPSQKWTNSLSDNLITENSRISGQK